MTRGAATGATSRIDCIDDERTARAEEATESRWEAAPAVLVVLLGSLISGHENSGGQLLLKGMTIWGTNVIAYGLWFWGFDRGGPVRRRQQDPPPPDFQFPQMENPQLAE